MKTLRQTFTLLFALISFTGLLAQTAEERKFTETVDSLNKQLSNQHDARNYQACETLTRSIIELYQTHADQLSEGYSYFKYAGYYNLACVQAKLGKKKEAVASLMEALEDGKLEISYKQVTNDPDLESIIHADELKPLLNKLREKTDYLYILKKAPEYAASQAADTLPGITYAKADDPDLVRVRQYFRLDSLATAGDELATIKNILTYIHNRIRHDGQYGNPAGGANAINYAEACKDGSRGLNCRGLATVLNECYLSLGIPSRVITCMPRIYINDCHVINAVYSSTLGKWLWIDPTNNAWVTDDKGNMLSIQEVRERLRTGQPVKVNEEANWNNKRKTETEDYLYNYMAKNLFFLDSWTRYGFNTESDKEHPVKYIFLQPKGCESNLRTPQDLSVNDDKYFWQAPQ